MILDTPLERAWAVLGRLEPARGTIAGHTGTARLESADDDTHTAVLRVHGSGRTITVTATLSAAGDGTRLELEPDAPHVFAATLAAALVKPGPPSRLVRA
jgi:hypothetical protein